MDDQQDPQQQQPPKSGGSSALKILGCGCGGLLILLVIGVMLAYIYGPSLMRQGAATGIDMGASAALEGIKVPEEDAAGIERAVKEEFTDLIRQEQLDFEQSARVFQLATQSPAGPAVAVRGFEAHHIQGRFDPEREQAAHVTATRFTKGVLDEQIGQDALGKLRDIAVRTTTAADGTTQYELKENLTDAEVEECLRIMADAADAAGIPQQEFDIDYEAAVRDALREAVAEAKANGTIPASEGDIDLP